MFGYRKVIKASTSLVLIMAIGLPLVACERKDSPNLDTMSTGSTGAVSLKKITLDGKKWEKDPGNVQAGLLYASGLQSIGLPAKRLEVLQTLAERNPKNPTLTTLYGKALVEAGNVEPAAKILENSVKSGTADWKTYSALGTAYDQLGRYADARAQYDKALALKPNSPIILNNMGMSYMLEGDLPKAEATLRQAIAAPGADTEPRVRQNLSLVVGLQGHFDQARDIASRDLPADQVNANMEYLKRMLAQSNTWEQLKKKS